MPYISAAEQFGIEKGKREGEIELIKKMLAHGVAPVFIAKNTGFPLHKIKELKGKN